jgi:hypothetical protein
MAVIRIASLRAQGDQRYGARLISSKLPYVTTMRRLPQSLQTSRVPVGDGLGAIALGHLGRVGLAPAAALPRVIAGPR